MVLTHRQSFLRKHNIPYDVPLSIHHISKLSKVPVAALQEVYNRGIGAWKSSAKGIRNEETGQKDYSASREGKMGKEQWAMARVYSFVDKGKTWHTTDSDIVKEYNLQ